MEKFVGLTCEFTANEKADAVEGSKLHPGTGRANFYPRYAQKCRLSRRCLENSIFMWGIAAIFGGLFEFSSAVTSGLLIYEKLTSSEVSKFSFPFWNQIVVWYCFLYLFVYI